MWLVLDKNISFVFNFWSEQKMASSTILLFLRNLIQCKIMKSITLTHFIFVINNYTFPMLNIQDHVHFILVSFILSHPTDLISRSGCICIFKSYYVCAFLILCRKAAGQIKWSILTAWRCNWVPSDWVPMRPSA